MKVCMHTNCHAMLDKRNITGLCKFHYDASRHNKYRGCTTCGALIRKYNISGYCIVHIPRKLIYVFKVPESRLDDYLFLRHVSNIKAAKARDIIFSGDRIDRTRKEKSGGSKASASIIVEYVAWKLRTTSREILSDARFRHIVEARACAAHIMRMRGWSTPAIGRYLSRDHSSIVSLLRNWQIYVGRRPALMRVSASVAGLTINDIPLPAFARAA